MATLLIIGGTGFFGKSILDAFLRGMLDLYGVDHVIAMSRHAEQLKRDAPGLDSSKISLVSANIAKALSLPDADIIIHAAASVDIRLYQEGGCDAMRNIEEGTDNFVQLARRHGRSAKYLYISSGAIYGYQDSNVSHLLETYSSDLDLLPNYKRSYAYAKRSSEVSFRRLGEEGMNISIARCFSFMGKWLPRDRQYAIGNFIDDGLNGRPIKVTSPKSVFRSYMHADDLVEWLMAIVTNSAPNCPVYNVGSDEAIEIREMAAMIANYYGVALDAAPITDPEIDRYVPSVSKARDELGVGLSYNMKLGLKSVISEIGTAPA